MGRAPAESASRLANVFETILGAHLSAYHPWLYQYCGDVAGPEQARKYLQYRIDLLGFGRADPREKRILDAGCGFGFGLIAYALLGAKEAHGIDIHRPMLDTLRAYLPLLPADISRVISVTEADAANMLVDDEFFDIVVSNEAISHYADVDGFLKEALRVVCRGGTLLIADGNNAMNPTIRRKTREVWRAFEIGSETQWLHTHRIDKSYRRRRAEIIAERFPQASTEDIEMLSARTFGMTAAQVARATGRYYSNGVKPSSLFTGDEVPVDPDTGIVIERPFDPFELAARLEQLGFRVRIAGYWGGAAGSLWVRLGNKALTAASRMMIRTAKSFRIAATKP